MSRHEAWTVEAHAAALMAAAPRSIERAAWDRAAIEAHQQAAMRALLAHAQAHSPFHARRLAGIDPATWRLGDLPSLPVMTKQDLMGCFDEVVTDPAISRRRAEAHLGTQHGRPGYLDGHHLVLTSGGSSGERGVFVWPAEAFTEFALTIVRRTLQKLMAFGVTGEQPLPGAIVAAGSPLHATAIVGHLIGAPGGLVAMRSVPATLPFDEIVRRLEELQPLVLVGYPSVLARLAGAKAAGRLGISPLAVSATSEPMPTSMRQAIEAAFGVPITNTFGSTEGLAGVSEAGSDAICFAEDTCIVELVDAAGQPVAPGEVADRVLVTNLVNHLQPLIRYELTDRFEEVVGEWPDGHLRATVEGRNDVPLRWGEVEVHPLVVRSALLHHPAVAEHQVHQTPDGLHVDVVAASSVDVAAIGQDVGAALVAAGLLGAAVSVAEVPTIPRDPGTGKARRFVPLAEAAR